MPNQFHFLKAKVRASGLQASSRTDQPEALQQMLRDFHDFGQSEEDLDVAPSRSSSYRPAYRVQVGGNGPRPVARRSQAVAIQDLWKQA